MPWTFQKTTEKKTSQKIYLIESRAHRLPFLNLYKMGGKKTHSVNEMQPRFFKLKGHTSIKWFTITSLPLYIDITGYRAIKGVQTALSYTGDTGATTVKSKFRCKNHSTGLTSTLCTYTQIPFIFFFFLKSQALPCLRLNTGSNVTGLSSLCKKLL